VEFFGAGCNRSTRWAEVVPGLAKRKEGESTVQNALWEGGEDAVSKDRGGGDED